MSILKELHPEWEKNCASDFHYYDISGNICDFCHVQLQEKIEGSQRYGKAFVKKIEPSKPKPKVEEVVYYDWHKEYLDEKRTEEFERRLEITYRAKHRNDF